MKRKRILILFSDVFNVGGIQRYNKHLCDALETEFSNYEFTGISLWDLRKNESKQWSNIKIIYFGKLNLVFLKKMLYVFSAMLALIKERPHFLICAHKDFGHLALFFKKIFGLKYGVITHGTDVWGLKRGMKYAGLKHADIITAVSQYTKDRMIKNGIDENKIRLLQDTIDTSLFYRKAINQNLIDDLRLRNRRVLLTVGRVSSAEKYKGHDVMLRVLGRLSEEYVWLVIGGGDDIPRLQHKAKELGIIEKVRFLGEIGSNQLIEYYNLCDCFVMPSKGEGFGIVFLEAMACGKPVIVGNKDGSSEPLMDGKLGFMVDPDSAEEIIKAINSACGIKEDKTNPEYLANEVEVNFGINVFNRNVKEIFSKYLL